MSDYIIYTTDNGVLNFKNDLRVFLGRSDVTTKNWNKIYTNVKEYYGTTVIGSTTLPANEKINIADISITVGVIMIMIILISSLFEKENNIEKVKK